MALSLELGLVGDSEPNRYGAVVSRNSVIFMQEATSATLTLNPFARKDSGLIWVVDSSSLLRVKFHTLELGIVLLNQRLAQPGGIPVLTDLQHSQLTLSILTARNIPVHQHTPDM